MRLDALVREVRSRCELAEDAEAERAIRSTVTVLAERLRPETMRSLAAHLPEELAAEAAGKGARAAGDFDAGESVRRVVEREGVPPAESAKHTRAVLDALRETLPREAWAALHTELPDDWDRLLDGGASPAEEGPRARD